MDGLDWYMIIVILAVLIVILAVLAVAVFFGWAEHLETMAGCLK